MARTSRWDRPPVPKDLRWGVRLFGKVLICIGLLMFGFVAYQLWGTGIEYARAQDRLDGRFEELMVANGVDPDFDPFAADGPAPTAAPTLPPTAATSGETEPATAAAADPPTGDTTPAPVGEPTAPPGPTSAGDLTTVTTVAPGASSPAPSDTAAPTAGGQDPTAPAGPTTSVEPQVLDWSYVDEEEFVGQLWIPSIGIEGQNVVQGVSPTDLQDGPGHYPDTPFPGELGNAAIAGHRTTWGAPFHRLPEVEVGDEIGFLLPDGRFYLYVMTGSETVNPEDSHVVATTDTTKATLTLTTCTPVNTAQQRYILYAEFVPERSSPVGAYVPRNSDGVAVLPGQDDVAPSATAPASTSASTTSPAASAAPADEAATAGADPAPTATVATAGANGATGDGDAPATPAAADVAPDTAADPAVEPVADPTDDPVVATAPATALGDEPAQGAEPAAGATETSAAAGGAGSDGDVVAAGSASDDAFSSHWFDDRAAIPHVAAWAAVCGAVVIAAYLLARQFKNSWIGIGVGIVPFFVTLYFFYQNVNRLLPAAL